MTVQSIASPQQKDASGSSKNNRILVLVSALAIGGMGIAASWWGFKQEAERELAAQENALHTAAFTQANSLQAYLQSTVNILPMLGLTLDAKMLDSADPTASQDAWLQRRLSDDQVMQDSMQVVGANLFQRYPQLLSLGWAPRVHPADIEAYEQAVRTADNTEFKLTGLDSEDSRPQPDIHMEVFFPLRNIDFSETAANDTDWLPVGQDLAQQPAWRDAMIRAQESGKLALTTYADDERSLVLAFYPLYAGKRLQGFVLATLDLNGMVVESIPQETVASALQIFDMTRSQRGALVYPTAAMAQTRSDATQVEDIEIQNQGLTLKVSFTAASLGLQRETLIAPWIILLAGLVITAALVGFMVSLMRQRQQVEALASARAMALSAAQDQLEESEELLVQSEKMSALGRMIAGVAHEVNTPLGFVRSNLELMGDYVKELQDGFESENADALKAFHSQGKTTDMADMVEESVEGISRISELVQSLKDFSRMDRLEVDAVDIHRCIDSTLTIAHNVVKNKAEIIREYGVVPKVPCAASQINQVLLNIITNAAQAIDKFGVITISTRVVGDNVEIAIKDTGKGMPEKVRAKIFEPFYTTKDVGQGTGLGLSISDKIIRQHNGEISVDSVEGVGTTFTIRLPLSQTTYQQAA